ncbi:GTP-binding protein HflX [Clostridium tetanomorphum]|nr:GTP-binding protein HflX [Clostridium tetanomorphum]
METDKRHIRERIYDLTKELEKIKKTRETQRDNRNDIPKVSLVGYTNAGKSTLRNVLYNMYPAKEGIQKENVFEADMLFATLDTTTRAILLPNNRNITLTDTVGFIRKLPHDLVEAFKSTLEEVIYSDVLLHVVDISSDSYEEQIQAVNEVLKELSCLDKPTILLLNKVDKINEEKLSDIREKFKTLDCIEISAKQGRNLEKLLEEIINKLPYKLIKAEYLIPYSDGSTVAYLHRNGNINIEEYKEEGTYISAEVDEKAYNVCKKYMISE